MTCKSDSGCGAYMAQWVTSASERRVNGRSLFWSSPDVVLVLEASRNPGLVDVFHQVRGSPQVAPRNWVIVVGQKYANQAKCTGGLPWPDRFELIRATFISPRTTASHNLAMTRLGRKGFKKKNTNKPDK